MIFFNLNISKNSLFINFKEMEENNYTIFYIYHLNLKVKLKVYNLCILKRKNKPFVQKFRMTKITLQPPHPKVIILMEESA